MSERAFSVVICTDSRLPYLKTTLRALRHLDYEAFEVVVVCGPTEDGTRAFVEGFAPKLKIAHCPDRNISRARNLGLALASGEFVAFLDDDAVPEAEWLADLNAAFADAEVAAAGGLVYDETGVSLQARYVTVDRLGYSYWQAQAPAPRLNFPFSPEVPHPLGANCAFRRDVLLALGGFDEEYDYLLDETDLVFRVNDAGHRIAQLARAAVHHKVAPSAARRNARVVRDWRPRIKNRVYFGYRNALTSHTRWDVLRAAIDDAALWEKLVEQQIAAGELPASELARFRREAEAGVEAGLAAAREPARKLMPPAPPPPPFAPYATLAPPGGRRCLALVTQDYPPGHNGGIARNVAELAAAYAREGHYVHVFTRARGSESVQFEDGVWVHRLAPADAGPAPDLIAPLKVPQELWNHSRAMFEAVARLDASRRVDMVYAPLWDVEPIAFLHEPRFPLVVALQTTLDFWLDSNPERRADPAWMEARGAPVLALERWCLQQAQRLHANSRAIVEDIARRYRMEFSRDRLIHAPHGVSDWAGGAQPEAGPVFLFVGRLESRKGIDTLLAAAPEVLRRLPDWRLVIVGDDAIEDGKYKRDFLARADIADVVARVRFHGKTSDAALIAHYRDCAVLLAPSRYESFGLVYVEGMMFGKPVIGGAGGGGAEVIGEAGLAIAPGDAAALAEAMLRLASDAALRRDLAAAARRRYEARFTAEAAAKALLDGASAYSSANSSRSGEPASTSRLP